MPITVKFADMAANAPAYSKPVSLADEIADFRSAANSTQ
jgi:hypothetical protein